MAFVTSVHTEYQGEERYADWKKALPSLRKYCYTLTGSRWDAEDLVQSTCLKMLTSVRQPDVAMNWEAYLIRSARNIWIDYIRQQHTQKRKLPSFVQVLQHEDHNGLDTELALQYLLECLSPWQRTIFVLREALGYKASETADLLHTTEGAVKAALSRARSVLAERRQQGYGPDSVTLPGNEQERERLKTYLAAFRTGDAQQLIELSLSDAVETTAVAGAVLQESFQSQSKRVTNYVSGGPMAVMAA